MVFTLRNPWSGCYAQKLKIPVLRLCCCCCRCCPCLCNCLFFFIEDEEKTKTLFSSQDNFLLHKQFNVTMNRICYLLTKKYIKLFQIWTAKIFFIAQWKKIALKYKIILEILKFQKKSEFISYFYSYPYLFKNICKLFIFH